jgi:hypothetical protein
LLALPGRLQLIQVFIISHILLRRVRGEQHPRRQGSRDKDSHALYSLKKRGEWLFDLILEIVPFLLVGLQFRLLGLEILFELQTLLPKFGKFPFGSFRGAPRFLQFRDIGIARVRLFGTADHGARTEEHQSD